MSIYNNMEKSCIPAPAIRIEDYQTEADFLVNIIANDLKQEDVLVEFGEQSFRVCAKLSDGTDYSKVVQCTRKIIPANCSYRVTSNKLEIRLNKLIRGTWPTLKKANENVATYFQPTTASSTKKIDELDKMTKKTKRKQQKESNDPSSLSITRKYLAGDKNIKRKMQNPVTWLQSGGLAMRSKVKARGKRPAGKYHPLDRLKHKKRKK